MEDYVNYTANSSVPKAMTLTEIENSTERDATLQAVIRALHHGNWEISSAFADFAKHKGFRHRKITPLWPRANGEAERFMRTIKKTMKTATAEGKN